MDEEASASSSSLAADAQNLSVECLNIGCLDAVQAIPTVASMLTVMLVSRSDTGWLSFAPGPLETMELLQNAFALDSRV